MATSLDLCIVERHKISGLFVDSTFKSNRKKVEVFAVILSVMRTGFLLGYLFLGSGSFACDGWQESQITLFSIQLRNACPPLNPDFFYTDNGAGQMRQL